MLGSINHYLLCLCYQRITFDLITLGSINHYFLCLTFAFKHFVSSYVSHLTFLYQAAASAGNDEGVDCVVTCFAFCYQALTFFSSLFSITHFLFLPITHFLFLPITHFLFLQSLTFYSINHSLFIPSSLFSPSQAAASAGNDEGAGAVLIASDALRTLRRLDDQVGSITQSLLALPLLPNIHSLFLIRAIMRRLDDPGRFNHVRVCQLFPATHTLFLRSLPDQVGACPFLSLVKHYMHLLPNAHTRITCIL
jgi:hypothetical protein